MRRHTDLSCRRSVPPLSFDFRSSAGHKTAQYQSEMVQQVSPLGYRRCRAALRYLFHILGAITISKPFYCKRAMKMADLTDTEKMKFEGKKCSSMLTKTQKMEGRVPGM